MIIKCDTYNDLTINTNKLIDLFEAEKDLVQVDKFGYEYIDCTKLPEKYDENTSFVGKVITHYAPQIKLFEPTKDGLRLDYVQIRKCVPGNFKPYCNERAWNRLDIHIPINKSTGGIYNFATCTVGATPNALLMFDPLREHWSVDEVKNVHYKLILRFRDLDKTLRYSGDNLNDEV